MRKLYTMIMILMVLSALLSACASAVSPDGQPGEVILRPDDPNNTGLVTGVDNSMTMQDQYEACMKAAYEGGYLMLQTQIEGQEVKIWGCSQGSLDGVDLALVPIGAIATLSPTQGDDAAIKGFVVIKESVKFAVVAGAAVIAGQTVAVRFGQLTAGQMYQLEETYGAGVTSAEYAEFIDQYYEMHNPDHDIANNLSAVQVMLENFFIWRYNYRTGKNRNDDFLCKVYKTGETIVAYSLWQRSDGRFLVWNSYRYVTTFFKTFEEFNTPPDSMKDNVNMSSFPCDQLPPMPMLPVG